ncbi:MAG: hypothetical protein KDC76_12870 [Bacteroidetes bacterium]|nr:hypothetical protein [Bacteroidota bacterium]
MRRILPIFSIILILALFSCRREDKVWENNILAPIFRAELSINDLVADTMIQSYSDGTYDLVYRYTSAIDSVGSYLNVPDTVDTVNVKLQSLILDDRTLTDTFTLREIDPSSGLLDGLTVPLTAYDIQDAGGSQEIDVSEAFFQTAKFNEGYLDVTLHNDLPVYVDLIVFQLSNKNDGSIVIRDTFTDIPEFSSTTRSISLAGKTVNGVMLGNVLRVKTRASTGPVLVDADKGVRIEMTVRDLQPEYATAIFPAQTLVHDTQEVVYRFGGPQITAMKAKSGFVKMKIFSTIEEEIVIDYSFPFSGENGDTTKPFKRQYHVPPAEPGKTQRIEASFPLDGFILQYKGKDPNNPPFVNTVYSELKARTVYSGKVRNLSLNDSVYIEFGLVDIVPEFAFGDFGTKKFQVQDPLDVKALRNVTGALSLEDVSMRLTYENGFGIEANTTMKSLKAINTRNNTSKDLTHTQLINQTILIGRMTNPPPTAYKRIYNIDKNNSNIKEFLEILPDQIVPDIEVVTRPNGSRDYTDFIFWDSYLKAHIDVTLPMTLQFNNLQFIQKQPFDFSKLNKSDRIKSGTFKLKAVNDFPVEASITLEFLDANENLLLTLFEKENTIEAASIPSGVYRTDGAVTSYLTATIDPTRMDILRDARYIRVISRLHTPSNGRTKLYSDYKIDTQLIADFIYEQNL